MSQVTRSNTKLHSAAAIMRPWCRLLLSALATVCVALLHLPALAASAPRFTLLSLNSLSQSVAAGYNYQESLFDYKTGKTRSTQQGFSESYSISAGYSILHPRLLHGDASVSLTSNQEMANKSSEGETSSSDTRISYSVNGIILDRKPYPVNFNIQSVNLTIRPPFSRVYSVDSQSQNVSSRIQNKYVPVTFSYGRTASETSGLVDDIKQTSQTAAITLSQRSGSLSTTTLALSQTSAQQILFGSGTTDTRDEFNGDLTNVLSWDNVRGLHRRLDTKYVYRELSGSSPGSQSNFGSALDWQIGKALDSRFSYTKSDNETALRNSSSLQSITGTLAHRYLKSLQTNVGGALVRGRYNDGSDVTTSLNAGVAYTKELPKDSRLGLDYGYRYSLQDRSRTDVNLSVLESVPLSAPFPQFLDLKAQNINSSTIVFYRDAGQTLPFTDFTVVLSGVQTRILINSDPGVPILYLKYSYQQSPKISFSTSGHSVGGHLGLLEDKHRLYVTYSWSEMRTLSGADPNSTIGGSTHLKAGVESKLTPHTLSLNYSSDKSVYQDLQNINALWTHTMGSNDAALLTRAEERYSWYESKSDGAAGSPGWDNTFLLSSSYSRSVIQNVKGTFTLGYFNLLTSLVNSNKFSIDIGLLATYGRTVVSLDSSSSWSVSSSGTARNQSVNLNARRSF